MERDFANVYEDEVRARAYADLGFPGTYYLAFRDIPRLLETWVRGTAALDFGCGTGRSTRFLKERGFSVLGVDIAEAMIARAAELDPEGEYLLVPDGDLSGLGERRFDLVLSAFTFDNVPDHARRVRMFTELGEVLAEGGRIVNLVSAPEIYVNEWTSFSTRDFPENRSAGSGDRVRIVMLDVPDRRPVEDIIWMESDYRAVFEAAGLEVLELHRPLGRPSDPWPWATEEAVSPWALYVLGRAGEAEP